MNGERGCRENGSQVGSWKDRGCGAGTVRDRHIGDLDGKKGRSCREVIGLSQGRFLHSAVYKQATLLRGALQEEQICGVANSVLHLSLRFCKMLPPRGGGDQPLGRVWAECSCRSRQVRARNGE